MASPQSYGTFRVLWASVAHESAASTPSVRWRVCSAAPAHKPNAPSTCTHAPRFLASRIDSGNSSNAPVCTSPACRHTMIGPSARLRVRRANACRQDAALTDRSAPR